jgi:hypothetical protein
MCLQIQVLFRQIRRYVQYIEELEQGINFSIVELNGAASEPTHIYDPKHSLFLHGKNSRVTLRTCMV